MDNETTDIIELVLPFKAEYVSTARLTVSGIANRIGFDIETIEDMKIAIAEVCNRFVSYKSEVVDTYKIIFEISRYKLSIFFDCKDKTLKCMFDDEEDKIGISLINAFMDNVVFCPEGERLFMMSKTLEENA